MYYNNKYPTVKEIENDIKKNRAILEKQKALKWKSLRGFKYFRKHESETEDNRKMAEMKRNE